MEILIRCRLFNNWFLSSCKKILFFAVLSCTFFSTPPLTGYAKDETMRTISEHQIKAAFLYNLVKYVSWPEHALPGNILNIGILGKFVPGDPFGSLNGKTINGRKINLIISNDIYDLSNCNVLFIQNSEYKHINRIMAAIGNDPILTVSDMEGFILSNNGIVRIALHDGKILFSINLKHGRAVGLDFSSHLLRLAAKVYQ